MAKTADVEMVSIPKPLYESLLETLEVLSDKSETESIRRGIRDIGKKRVILKGTSWRCTRTWCEGCLVSFRLVFTEEFGRNLDKAGDKKAMKRILKKVLELRRIPNSEACPQTTCD